MRAGRALVYDNEESFLAALTAGALHARLGRSALSPATKMTDIEEPPAPAGAAAASQAQQSAGGWTSDKLVCIIRYEGPKGGPGMPEMLTPTSAIMGAGGSWLFVKLVVMMLVVSCIGVTRVTADLP